MIRGLARVISEAPLLYRHAQIYTLTVLNTCMKTQVKMGLQKCIQV